jgi:hypothetical protein
MLETTKSAANQGKTAARDISVEVKIRGFSISEIAMAAICFNETGYLNRSITDGPILKHVVREFLVAFLEEEAGPEISGLVPMIKKIESPTETASDHVKIKEVECTTYKTIDGKECEIPKLTIPDESINNMAKNIPNNHSEDGPFESPDIQPENSDH